MKPSVFVMLFFCTFFFFFVICFNDYGKQKKKKQARSDKHIYARIVVLHIFVLEPHTKPIQTHTMASLVSFTDSSYEDGNPLHA